MWLYDWFWELLFRFGFVKKDATLLLLGLDNAGKTTLLMKMRHGTFKNFMPTERSQLEEVEMAGVRLRAWDLGGHEAVRALWRDYFVDADAVVFMVDASDAARLPEARDELQRLLGARELDSCVFAVLANKTDLAAALPTERIVGELGLGHLPLGRTDVAKPVEVFACSLLHGTGYQEAFQWLAQVV